MGLDERRAGLSMTGGLSRPRLEQVRSEVLGAQGRLAASDEADADG